MADQDIQVSQLPTLVNLTNTDLLHVKRGTIDYKVTFQELFKTHVTNLSNPHSVTKAQVGLSNVTDNLQLTVDNNLSDVSNASTARTNINVYSKPETTAQINLHANLTTNPHSVTKAQIGLSNVSNWTHSTNYLENTDTKYSTIGATYDAYQNAVSVSAQALSTHVSATNPHGLTKSTIGLGSVQNWTFSTNYLDTSNSKYATIGAVNAAYNALISNTGGNLTAHLNATNPHNITKATVGLGSVANYGNTSSYTTNSTSLYANAKAVRDGVTSAKTSATLALNGHTGNVSNPHSVTKAQVGLSSVMNSGGSSSFTSSATTVYANSRAVRDGTNHAISSAASYTDNKLSPDAYYAYAGVGSNEVSVSVNTPVTFSRAWNTATRSLGLTNNLSINSQDFTVLTAGIFTFNVEVVCTRNTSARGILVLQQQVGASWIDRAFSIWRTDEEGEQVTSHLGTTVNCAANTKFRVLNVGGALFRQVGISVSAFKQ